MNDKENSLVKTTPIKVSSENKKSSRNEIDIEIEILEL
jgi:hypothetical protein